MLQSYTFNVNDFWFTNRKKHTMACRALCESAWIKCMEFVMHAATFYHLVNNLPRQTSKNLTFFNTLWWRTAYVFENKNYLLLDHITGVLFYICYGISLLSYHHFHHHHYYYHNSFYYHYHCHYHYHYHHHYHYLYIIVIIIIIIIILSLSL